MSTNAELGEVGEANSVFFLTYIEIHLNTTVSLMVRVSGVPISRCIYLRHNNYYMYEFSAFIFLNK